MKERPPLYRVAANILNKQSRTADKGCSSRLGVGRGTNNSTPWKRIFVMKFSQRKPREELHDLYSSPTIVRVMKSRIIRWVGHVARMGKGDVCTGF
jgi:hypothetical protein